PSGSIISLLEALSACWKHYRPAGSIVASWGLDVRRKLLLFYRNFGLMSPHPEELLQIYIILGPFASNRSETGEIPVILQDSLSGIVVHIELLYFCRISLTESACLEKSWSLRISPAGWACLGKWCSFQDGGNIHFPAQNFFFNSLKSAGFRRFYLCISGS
ncbi:hypothetical protein, partial [uncultured Paenibacillus sp.]|uniref:hypothetical protein n=1 Tax=uncultured Paenibacillus sp. TaxID=227322 RepID=UPI0025EDBB3B